MSDEENKQVPETEKPATPPEEKKPASVYDRYSDFMDKRIGYKSPFQSDRTPIKGED